jgi:hypothetical protein
MIVAGVQASIAARIAAMAGGKAVPPVVFTGGVAMIRGMDRARTPTPFPFCRGAGIGPAQGEEQQAT